MVIAITLLLCEVLSCSCVVTAVVGMALLSAWTTCHAGRLAVRRCPPAGQQPVKPTKALYTRRHTRYSDSLSASVSPARWPGFSYDKHLPGFYVMLLMSCINLLINWLIRRWIFLVFSYLTSRILQPISQNRRSIVNSAVVSSRFWF